MDLRKHWVWWLALTGGLLTALGGVAAQTYLALVAMVLVGGGALLATLWQARTASIWLTVLLVTAVATPITVIAGLTVPFLLAGFVWAAWVVQPLVLRRHVPLDRSPLSIATVALSAVAALAFLVGQYPWFPAPPAPMNAQLGGLALFLFSAGLLLVVGHQVSSPSELSRLTWLFVCLGAVIVVVDVVPVPGLGPYLDRVTRPDTIGSMFWVWLVAMSLSQALFNRAVSLPRRTLALGVATLALARGWFYAFSWVSGWLPPVLAAAILLLIRFPRTMLGLGLLSVAPVVAASGRAIDALMVGESYSWMTRLEAFEVISRLLERNPWLGFGPANYYHYTILHPILGWWVRFNSHNTYVDLLAQTGVIGLLVFVWAAFEAARLAVALQSRLPWGFARAYAAGAFAGLVASLAAAWLADWIIPFAYNVGVRGFRSSLLFWFFLGGLLVLRRAVLSTRGRPAETRDFRWEAAS